MRNALNFYEKIRLLEIDHFSFPELRLRFHELAQTLLNESLLYIANHPYRICEIEFYSHSDLYNDPYTHQADEQKEFGQWYFHKKRNAYNGGNYKGLDLTLGDGINHLGILIRRIEDCANNKTTDGPSLVVDKILELTSSSAVSELVLKLSPEMLKLVYSNSLEQREWLMSPRVGLKAKGMSNVSFLFAPLRYLTNPWDSQKGKPLVYLSQYVLYGYDKALEKTKMRTVEAKKYQEWFHMGQQIPLDEALKKPMQNTQAICELFGSHSANEKPQINDDEKEVSVEELLNMAIASFEENDWGYLNYLTNLGVESCSEDEKMRLEFMKLRGISNAHLTQITDAKKDFLSVLEKNPNDEVVLVNFLTACFQSQDVITASQGLKIFYPNLNGTCKSMVLDSICEAIRAKDFSIDLLPLNILEDVVPYLKIKKIS